MNKMRLLFVAIIVVPFLGTVWACSKKREEATKAPAAANKGIGPVTNVALGTINSQMAIQGEKIFKEKCSACHKLEERYVGPALKGVTQRRSPEWIMNMILNPTEMTEKDPVAQELLATYLVQMTFQNVTQDEARNILEYFRHNDAQ